MTEQNRPRPGLPRPAGPRRLRAAGDAPDTPRGAGDRRSAERADRGAGERRSAERADRGAGERRSAERADRGAGDRRSAERADRRAGERRSAERADRGTDRRTGERGGAEGGVGRGAAERRSAERAGRGAADRRSAAWADPGAERRSAERAGRTADRRTADRGGAEAAAGRAERTAERRTPRRAAEPAGRARAERPPAARSAAGRRGPAGGRQGAGRPGGGSGGGQGGGGLRLGRPKPRLRLAGVLLTVVMLTFVVRLCQVQFVDATELDAKADVNRYQPVEIAADRGTITDRDGVPLATTVDAYDITADPYLFTPGQSRLPDAPAKAAAVLAPLVHGDARKLAALLATPKSRYVLLARAQSPQVWDRIKAEQAKLADSAAEHGAPGLLAGVLSEPTSKRVYPNGDLAAGVLGFVNEAGQGAGGLEAELDKELTGRPGKMTYAQSGGQMLPTSGLQEQAPVPGTSVELTLDRDIQWAAQDAISRQVRTSKADRGYVIVQDTRTGQVLAMADAPGFNPNDLTHADPAALGNPALQDAYEPGSVSKLMSMSAVINQGVATPQTHVVVPNTLQRGDRVFHDDADHGTEYLTLAGVLAESSNIGTIEATGQLGRTQAQADRVLYSYLKKFGIGSPTGLDFPGETPGILAKPQAWSTSQQYTIPFGQGLSVNAMQATSIYSTIADGGVRIAPSLVKGTTGPDGRFTPAAAPRRTRVVTGATAKAVTRMLESVVGSEEGTGVQARIPGYQVAGKTGTANRVDPATGRYHGYTSSFFGFAPADDPRVTVSCVIQNPTVGSYFGGSICGPVFKQVMEFALKTLQVPPSGASGQPLPVTFAPGT